MHRFRKHFGLISLAEGTQGPVVNIGGTSYKKEDKNYVIFV